MKLIGRIVLLLLVAIVGLGLFVSLKMFDDAPAITGSGVLAPTDLAQAKAFLRKADPRNLKPGTITTLAVHQSDLEKGLNYALENYHGGRSQVSIAEGIAKVQFSMKMPVTVLGNYLNAVVGFSKGPERLQVQELRLGGVQIPSFLIDKVIFFAHQQVLARVPEYGAALAAIDSVNINDGVINVKYQWQPQLMEQLTDRGRDLLVSPESRERLLAHAAHLATLTNGSLIPRKASLARLIGPMFRFAKSREGDPVEENRAAIAAMALYIMEVNIADVVGQPENAIPRTAKHEFMLSERHDFAQHFLVSAGLTTSTGTGLADTIGLLKELDDSQSGGSGFSFTDLGADRTGVRLAELAIADAAAASKVQAMLGVELDEALFMAEFRDLPEFMPEAEFKQRFGGVGEPAYNAVAQDIEARISRMPFFQQMQP